MASNSDKILHLVYADTYGSTYGAEIEVFGIADNKEDLKKICAAVQKEGHRIQTKEIKPNEFCKEYLGGYYE